jgi:penicillin-binding protein 1C
MTSLRIRSRVVRALAITIVAATAVVAFCPRPSLYGDVSFSSVFSDRNGELLRLTLAGDDRYRLRTSLDDVAATAIDATLLYEDRYFYKHPGFNPAALARATWSTYAQRNRVMGASTITMQLARIRFGLDTRSVGGKLRQIARAVQLERHYSKQQILEAYLNLAPYGGNVEGIGTAALIYFDKPASELSLPEALALAVVPQNPVRRNPVRSNNEQWLAARKRLLDQWQRQHETSPDSAQLIDLPLAVRDPRQLPFLAPHFVQRVDNETDRLDVRTTLDLGLQRVIETQIDNYVNRRQTTGVRNASAILVDTRTMQVLASVGSADFFDDGIEGQVDGTTAKRSPGSTLKPFVYGMAIDDGLIHPASLMKDAPRRFAAYTPENFDRGFMGPVSAQDALVYSRNVPAIELLGRVGHKRFHEFLETGQVSDLAEADFYGLAMVLGGIELTMEEILRLYAMLANGGTLRNLAYTARQTPGTGPRLLSPEASFLVLDMLRHNERPDGLAISSGDSPVAWKTGTSYAFRDAWSVGIVGHYALAVWVGNFDGSGNPAFVGRQAAAPLFFSVVDALVADDSSLVARTEPRPGLNLRKVDVCAGTGDLPGRHCPRTRKAWFVPGVSPIRVSDVHRALRIRNDSGLRSCNPGDPDTREEVYEFWPSDISALFRKAGIAVRRPPRWSPECSLDVLASTGNAPEIRSLSEKLSYQLRPDSRNALPLTAATDADVRWLYWFVDQHFLGRSPAGDALLWEPAAGRHQILAVDDLGRSDSIDITLAIAPR